MLDIDDIQITEGSGISRENRVSAIHMNRILERFEPNRALMRRSKKEYYKTGTLEGIKTRAGYLQSGKGGLYRFVVLLNTPGKSTTRIMRQLTKALN
jgi:D-alanyl-D-alanine carboxypeptidase/D-alanyl-D-alanine-endopeptidase (penicillin-binding protein 4)